ncbi:MAG: HAD-IIA family hydrolase [Anaerolineaceae bacterium]|nr:HAD-IIA family hydrolase [Anaerolineaceae bacterium]
MLTERFPQLKGLILDMDGVLWKDMEPIGDLPLNFRKIRELGLKPVLATNNSTLSASEYQAKCARFGVFLEPEQIITSATLTVSYLKRHFPLQSQVYVIGSNSFQSMISEAGFAVTNKETKPNANIVVVGLDRELTYKKIGTAANLVRNGAAFIASNPDSTFPTPAGLEPGAGTMVAAVETASGQKALVLGKPMPHAYLEGSRYLGLQPHEIMGIGDRLSTDIAGAQAAGCLGGFVCSGVNTHEEALDWQPPIDIIAADLWSLLND